MILFCHNLKNNFGCLNFDKFHGSWWMFTGHKCNNSTINVILIINVKNFSHKCDTSKGWYYCTFMGDTNGYSFSAIMQSKQSGDLITKIFDVASPQEFMILQILYFIWTDKVIRKVRGKWGKESGWNSEGGEGGVTDAFLKNVRTLWSKQNKLTSAKQRRHNSSNWKDCRKFERSSAPLEVQGILANKGDVTQTSSEVWMRVTTF